jgi:hypothetical protein
MRNFGRSILVNCKDNHMVAVLHPVLGGSINVKRNVEAVQSLSSHVYEISVQAREVRLALRIRVVISLRYAHVVNDL